MRMRTPLAPFCIALSQRCFTRRRKFARFLSCSPIVSAMRRASISGLRTSTTLMTTLRPVRPCSSLTSCSLPEPLMPSTWPGRAVLMTTVSSSRVRSMWMSLTAA